MVGDELFRAGHQTACRIVRSIPAIYQVLGEIAEGASVSDDAGWPPSLESLVVTFKYFRREPEAVEGLDIFDEAINAVAQTVGLFRIKMMAPEISDPRAGGQLEPSHKGFSAALAPFLLFWTHPDLGRRSAGSLGGIEAQMVRRDRGGD